MKCQRDQETQAGVAGSFLSVWCLSQWATGDGRNTADKYTLCAYVQWILSRHRFSEQPLQKYPMHSGNPLYVFKSCEEVASLVLAEIVSQWVVVRVTSRKRWVTSAEGSSPEMRALVSH